MLFFRATPVRVRSAPFAGSFFRATEGFLSAFALRAAGRAAFPAEGFRDLPRSFAFRGFADAALDRRGVFAAGVCTDPGFLGFRRAKSEPILGASHCATRSCQRPRTAIISDPLSLSTRTASCLCQKSPSIREFLLAGGAGPGSELAAGYSSGS